MSKIKVSKNKKIVAFDFYSNLLDNDKLCNLCKLFNLQDIYMDIYTCLLYTSDAADEL